MENNFMGLEGQSVPEMPDSFIEEVTNRYIQLYEKVTGQEFMRGPLNQLDSDIKTAVNNWIQEDL